jgi:predicted alpha/beta superfamily hydrolase
MLKKTLIIAACIFCAGNFLLAQDKKSNSSSSSSNVHIVDTSFFIPQLNRYRRVWIYLPATYTATKKKYPVIYMQDGQNVFDQRTSFAGGWGVDEALDTLGLAIGESIVVAIDNGGEKRMNEYSPYDMEKYGKGEGGQYIDFIAKTLRPYINKHYRTKKCRSHTFIAGSSMGGLISFYALLRYPKVFGGAGVFSPSLWIAPQLKEEVTRKGKKLKGKIYLYAGKLESKEMVPQLLDMFNILHQHSKAKITTVVRAEGKHNEASWRQEFPVFYKWLMK